MQGIGPLVAAARRRAGISQRELARRLGVSQPRVAHIEKGKGATSLAYLERIGEALGMDLVVVFTPRDEHDIHDARVFTPQPALSSR
jgi:transcriptional regulator with XRE-family HTH domain